MPPAHSRQRDGEQSLRGIKELDSAEDQSETQGAALLPSASMSKKVVINSYHLPPSPRMILLKGWCVALYIDHYELYIRVGEALGYPTMGVPWKLTFYQGGHVYNGNHRAFSSALLPPSIKVPKWPKPPTATEWSIMCQLVGNANRWSMVCETCLQVWSHCREIYKAESESLQCCHQLRLKFLS